MKDNLAMITTITEDMLRTTDRVTDWLDPDQFRTWAIMLIRSSGLHWRIVAALVDISPTAMSHLLWGRHGHPITRLHTTTARALMSLSPETITTDSATLVCATPARRTLDELHQTGWTDPQLSDWLTRSDLSLTTERAALYCTHLTAARIQATYDYLVTSTPATRPLSA